MKADGLSVPNQLPRFADLYFGMSDSYNEATAEAEHFVQSYVDINETVEKVVTGDKTLILGPKGTGKSALAMYLKKAGRPVGCFAEVKDAAQLPLAEIPQIETGQPAGIERTVSAWRFILLCNYLQLLVSDPDCKIKNKTEVQRVLRYLRQFGFMGEGSARALLRVAEFTIPISQTGSIYRREKQESLNIFSLTPYLEAWAYSAESPYRHVLLLDGLDSIFLNDEMYDESVASLTQAAYSINQRLADQGASGSIVLLLRNDVFSRISLSLPDAQKMRDDRGINLDWRVLSMPSEAGAPLVRLANQKAGKLLGLQSVPVMDYFPKDIEVGGRNGSPRWFPRLQYFLNLTRHTPRDFLRLLDEIRSVEKAGFYEPSGRTISRDVIREGVLQYSTRYFVDAIKNEFAGYQEGTQEARDGLSALQSLGKQRFNAGEFTSALRDIRPELSSAASRILTLLFFSGAIGNVAPGREKSYVQFYHRRNDSEVYLKGSFVLHNALVHAWQIPFSG